jgi:rod shape determining protein RodA
MQNVIKGSRIDVFLLLGIFFLVSFSVLILRSINPQLFPLYFVYIAFGILFFYLTSRIDFDIYLLFSKHFYILSIILLVVPLLLGKVTRGTVRWIPLGPLSIQPAELVRPFLIIFFTNYLIGKEINLKLLAKSLALLTFPVFLIVIQPSLGVAVLTVVAFLGVLIASSVNKKYFLLLLTCGLVLVFISFGVLAPYQRQRIISFLSPLEDPLGAGYNSIQSMIAVGAGRIFGRGLGRGVQTQLAFLPEKHADFIFAATAEELGFVGAVFLILGIFFVLFRLTSYIKNAPNLLARGYLSGFFLVLFVQAFVNIGMNLGLLPITGVPLPLVSAGGSSFLATMTGLGIALSTRK